MSYSNSHRLLGGHIINALAEREMLVNWEGGGCIDRETAQERVKRVLGFLLELPDFVPPKRNGGKGDSEWLFKLSESFERRARKRLPLTIKPRETWDLADGFRRAAEWVDTLEYERDE